MASVRLSRINIPEPNPAVAAFKKSARMRAIMEHLGNTGVLLYQARVRKRTARLARSARAHTEIGGVHHDGWIGVITVGAGVPHELPHEFGADVPLFGDDDESTPQKPARDLNFVLENLAEYS